MESSRNPDPGKGLGLGIWGWYCARLMPPIHLPIGIIGGSLEASFVYFVVCVFFMTCESHPEQFLLAGLAFAAEHVSRSLIPAPATRLPQNDPFRTPSRVLGSRAS